jgi:hypothetical protein
MIGPSKTPKPRTGPRERVHPLTLAEKQYNKREQYNKLRTNTTVSPESLTKTQVIKLLPNENTDDHIYLIAIFNTVDTDTKIFIKSSTPYTLSADRDTNINIKGTNMVFFKQNAESSGYVQITDIQDIPKLIFDNNIKVIRTRMHDINTRYNGLSTSQYFECNTISFSDASTIGSNDHLLHYTLDDTLLQNTNINTMIGNEATALTASINTTYGKQLAPEKVAPITATSLPSIIITFRKYIEYLYRIPFMYKLNALTPSDITTLYKKTYIVTTTTLKPEPKQGTSILKELIDFSYIKLSFKPDMKTVLTDLLYEDQSYTQIIENDTKIYKLLDTETDDSETDDSDKYIHILHFIELIENVWTTVFSIDDGNTSISTYFDNFYSMVIQNILKSNQQIEQIYSKLTNINNKPDIYPDTQAGQIGIPLRVHVDRLLSEKNSNDFITYLKINNTEGNTEYNKRYCLNLNQILGKDTNPISTSMLLNYNANHNFPYYTKGENGVVTSDDIKKKSNLPGQFQQHQTTTRAQNDNFTIEKYDNQYVFGHYNRIFPVTDSTDSPNSAIAKKMPEIIKQICENKKPVFMLGYGASGSGKTSSLIHLNKGNGQTENGVVVHLCEEIVRKGITIDDTKNSIKLIKVVIYEKYNDDDNVVEKETCDDENSCDVHATNTKTVNFQVKEDGGKIIFITNCQTQPTRTAAAGGSVTEKESSSTYNHSDNVNIRNGINESAYILAGKGLGEVLKELVDIDRLVRATTNNRQSSRSHVLIGIHFYKDDKYNPANYLNSLIVGDLAGKENVFKCNDVNTILSFLNEEIGDGSPNKGKPFYSVLESIKTIKETDPAKYLVEKQKHKNRIGNNKPVFSFTNPGNYFESYSNQEFIKPIINICLNNRNILDPKTRFTDVEIYEKIYNDNPTRTKFESTLSFMNILDAYKRNCVYKPVDEKMQLSIKDMCTEYLKQREAVLNQDESTVVSTAAATASAATAAAANRDFSDSDSDSDTDSDTAHFSIFEILYLTLYENDLYKNLTRVYKTNGAGSQKPYYTIESPVNADKASDKKNRRTVCELVHNQSTLMYNKIKHPRKPKIPDIPAEINGQYMNNAIYTLITYHLLYIFEATNTKVSKANVTKIITTAASVNTDLRYTKLDMCFNKNEIPIDIAQDVIFTIKFETKNMRDTPLYKTGQFAADYNDGNTGTIEQLVNSGIFITRNQDVSREGTDPAQDISSLPIDLLPIDLLSIMINDFVFYEKTKKRVLTSGNYKRYLDELMSPHGKNHYRSDKYTKPTKSTSVPGSQNRTRMHFGGGGQCQTYNKEETQHSSLFPAAHKLQHFINIDIKEISPNYADNFKGTEEEVIIQSKLLNTEFTNIILQCLAHSNLKTYPRSPLDFYRIRTNKFHETLIEINTKFDNNTPYWYRNTTDDKSRLVTDILTAINSNDNVSQEFNVFIIHKLDDIDKVIPIYKTFKIEQLCKFLYTSYETILSPYFKKYPGDTTTGRLYKNFFKGIFDNMQSKTKTKFYEYIDLFKKVDDVISETVERIHYGKEICDERVIEGKYINSSLDTMRQTIKTILTEKHKASQALFSSPTFVDQCLKSYCPTGVNCFNTTYNAKKEITEKRDSLFEQIFEDLKNVKGGSDYKLDSFYKDIVLCVFGVFNISRLADNPPKVPYIDINNLKRLFYNDNASIQKLAFYELKNTQKLLTQLPMITLDDIGKDIMGYFQAVSKQSSTVQSLKEKLEIIIKKIDLHNASSSIGTLETVNTIAMLGNVDTLCDKKSIYHNKLVDNVYTRGPDYTPNHKCKQPGR